MKNLGRSLLFALGITLAGIAPGAAQTPIPALPDTARVATYTPTVSTGPFAVPFAIYGDGTDYQNWIEVWLDGVKLTPVSEWTLSLTSGTIATAARPLTNAQITLTTARSGTLVISGAQRPRRLSQFSENRGVTAHDLNQTLTGLTAQNRETWDEFARTLRAPAGETLTPIPSAADRMGVGGSGTVLGFDGATGLPISALLSDLPTMVVGTPGAAGNILSSNGPSAIPTFKPQLTPDDLSAVATLGRFSSGYPWSIIRPSTTSSGIEVRDFPGNTIAQFSTNSTKLFGVVTTEDDTSSVTTLGRFDGGTPWSLIRPSTTSSGLEFRTFAGAPIVRMSDFLTQVFSPLQLTTPLSPKYGGNGNIVTDVVAQGAVADATGVHNVGTDNSTAFQAAANVAGIGNPPNLAFYSAIHIPCGIYRITKTISFKLTDTVYTVTGDGQCSQIYFDNAAPVTGTTNGTTASGNATLHFASTPASIVGLHVFDTTTPGAIPAGTTVLSVTGTTAVLSANAAGGGVGSGDAIEFGERSALFFNSPVCGAGNIIPPCVVLKDVVLLAPNTPTNAVAVELQTASNPIVDGIAIWGYETGIKLVNSFSGKFTHSEFMFMRGSGIECIVDASCNGTNIWSNQFIANGVTSSKAAIAIGNGTSADCGSGPTTISIIGNDIESGNFSGIDFLGSCGITLVSNYFEANTSNWRFAGTFNGQATITGNWLNGGSGLVSTSLGNLSGGRVEGNILFQNSLTVGTSTNISWGTQAKELSSTSPAATVVLPKATTANGALTLTVADVTGNQTITFPAGTTNFGATGGTSQVVKQTSVGGAFTVAQLSVTDISGLGTGVATFLATPTSANLASAITDETGSGALVFGTAPTIASPVFTGTASMQNFLTTDDQNALLTFGRFSSGTPWSLIRPSATSNGIEIRDFSGNQIVQFSTSAGAAIARVFGYVQTLAVSVASLPTCNSGSKGARQYVDDASQALTAGIGAIVAGSGANNVPVGCDGTNWRIGG